MLREYITGLIDTILYNYTIERYLLQGLMYGVSDEQLEEYVATACELIPPLPETFDEEYLESFIEAIGATFPVPSTVFDRARSIISTLEDDQRDEAWDYTYCIYTHATEGSEASDDNEDNISQTSNVSEDNEAPEGSDASSREEHGDINEEEEMNRAEFIRLVLEEQAMYGAREEVDDDTDE